MTRKYIVRSLKYMVRMIVLIAIVLLVMALTGTLNTGYGSIFEALFLSRNGLILLAAMLLLAGVYPRMSFSTSYIPARIEENRQVITDSFAAYGYSPVRSDGNTIIFRADSVLNRLLAQYDDVVTVTGKGDGIEIEGMKRIVSRVELRLRSMLEE